MSREIASPVEVDTLSKLTEWLQGCGMPQMEMSEFNGRAPPPEGERRLSQIDHAKLSLPSAKDMAQALYARFCDPRYRLAIWRVRPILTGTNASDIECRFGLLRA